MRKKSLLILLTLLITAPLFAITDGIVTIPTDPAGSENTSIIVEATASELEQGILLKYGTSDSTATEVTGTIEKSATESWNVFANQVTDHFYFFGTGRATESKSINIMASATTFQNGAVDTQVQPTITGYDTVNGWDITIAAANPSEGDYTGTSFTIAWDGSNAASIATTPAGTYTTTVTLTVTNN